MQNVFKRVSIVLILLVFSCFSGGVAAEKQPERKWTKAEWRFEEKTGEKAEDSGDGKLHAKIQNAIRVPGKTGSALKFLEKKSCAIIPFSRELQLTKGPFTIECWINPDKIEKSKSYEIINKGADTGPGWRLYITWRMVTFRSGYGKKNAQKKSKPLFWEIRSNANKVEIAEKQWTHIAVTRDEKNIAHLYINGIEQAKSEKEFTITPSKGHYVYVGNYCGWAYQFEGAIDEVCISKKAKSAEEIFRTARLEN